MHSQREEEKSELDLGLFRELISYSNDMVFILNMKSMKFEYINKTACDELGYSFDEMQALGIEGFRKSLPEDDSFSEHIAQLKQSQGGLTDYAILVRKDGSEMHIEAKVRIVKRNGQEYNVAMVRDITERVHFIEELKRQAQRTQNYLDIAQVIIVALDKNKKVMMINQKGADLLGYSKEEIIGKNWMENFLPESVRADIHKVGDEILKKPGAYDEVENPVLTKSGDEYLVSWKNTALLDDEGNAIGILSSGEDITKKREKERQLMLHTKQAQMGEMIGMIAHQWRQPLAAISATVATLQLMEALDEYDKSYYDKQLNNMELYTQHLSKTIEDFRNFFKEDKKQVNIKLSELLQSAIDIIKPIFIGKDIEITVEHTCEEEISTYPNELKQVILNILKNSEEVIEERKIKNGKVEIKTYKQNDEFHIAIKDNAGGIPAEVIDKLFDPYFTTKEAYNGTGLGLYMSRTIVEEHCRGRLEVKNSDGGALFLIRMNKTI